MICHKLKYLMFFLAGVLIHREIFCQIIQGKIVDQYTSKPIEGVSVYINNTSFGTNTNQFGEFVLPYRFKGEFQLVVTQIGYERKIKKISSDSLKSKYLFYLIPKENRLMDVEVQSSDRNGWSKWGTFFLEAFVGTSKYANKCHLINANDLIFKYSKGEKTLQVYAYVPLIFENFSLGYHIEVQLSDFIYDVNNKYLYTETYSYFKEMQGNKHDLRKWKNARNDAYLGSLMHFIRSVYSNQIVQEGFQNILELKVYMKKIVVKFRVI